MQNKRSELADEVRILELEEKKLGLEKRIAQLKAEQSIDEGCVGCAGPCKVVDVAAELQKELDEYKEAIQLERIDHATALKTVNQYHHAKIKEHKATIEELKDRNIKDLKDRNIKDLKELYDLYEDELRGIKADRTSIKSDRDIMFQNYQNTVAKLQADIKGLEVELSARKKDSAVLMKVVEAVRQYDGSYEHGTMHTFNHVFDLLVDYHDAPEEHKTPIDDLYKVTVTYAFLEMP